MKRCNVTECAEALSNLYAEGFDGKRAGKFTIRNKTLCTYLMVRTLWPSVLSRLIDELGRKGLLLVSFEDRHQIVSFQDILKKRKLPHDKCLEILKMDKEGTKRPFDFVSALYETKFNRWNRGAFRADRQDMAALCRAEYLTSEMIQELANELYEPPSDRQPQNVRQGYTLIDAGKYLAVVETKLVWRIHLCTEDHLPPMRNTR